jgi:hypothetical protein
MAARIRNLKKKRLSLDINIILVVLWFFWFPPFALKATEDKQVSGVSQLAQS